MLPMGLGQESGREGEVVSWQAGESACVRVAMSLPKSVVCGYCSRIWERRPAFYDCIRAFGA